MKRLLLLLALAAGLYSPAFAAGTISLSLSQQLDNQARPLSGCLLYTYEAATTTPQSAFIDSNLTIPHPWPLVCDSAGRLPQFFLDDGSVRVRLTDRNGVVQIDADSILVVGPSAGGGGGGGSVDPTTIYQTGDLKWRHGTGTLSGWVRMNGRTIGSATSGATERANADTQALFEYLWNADSNLSVSGGRGASAAADWAANKTITLPDARGRALAALDDMGATSAARLNTLSSTILGAVGGAETHTLTVAQMPSHNHTATSTVFDPTHAHSVVGAVSNTGGSGGAGAVPSSITTGYAATGISVTTTIANNGGGQAHNIVQPTILATLYIKL